ncbi:MAG: heavy metal-binding domain-containing protein [Bacteroidota bacterium]
MKQAITGFLIAATTLTACESSSTKTESQTKTTDSIPVVPKTEQAYACPMHPEVKGKKGDKCPKCEMELSVLVK